MADISRRKDDHLDLATSGDVGFHQTTTLFERVRQSFQQQAAAEQAAEENEPVRPARRQSSVTRSDAVAGFCSAAGRSAPLP